MGPEEKLFRQHYKSLCHFAWKFVGESSVAEDLVQEAFITFLGKNSVWMNRRVLFAIIYILLYGFLV
ncbi:hypothetical protein KUH03_23335 [Sphingobacterium sp. E70]|uniref:sigma factor n=1 Tax=Sphingobacterium sp. E70 TaxID=2853439 RepID=UPI00211B9103|nr:sigma factor [Sphingobacterium sp. E70]ULT22361.1 hypothetical protein KUH03_23335 [Sphingobacterium sp. E70]